MSDFFSNFVTLPDTLVKYYIVYIHVYEFNIKYKNMFIYQSVKYITKQNLTLQTSDFKNLKPNLLLYYFPHCLRLIVQYQFLLLVFH